MDTDSLFTFFANKMSNVTHDILGGSTVLFDIGFEFNGYFDKLKQYSGATFVKHGATKTVLYFKDMPRYVFKIPITGVYTPFSDSLEYAEECITKECDDDIYSKDYDYLEFSDYCGAGLNIDGFFQDDNYCEVETFLTEQAQKENIDCCFAKTFFIGTYKGFKIYCSEYVDTLMSNPDVYDSIRVSEKSKYRASLVKNCELEDIAEFYECYGDDIVNKLLGFINKYDIKDFHCENIGVTKDAMIKIIDYSSFNE